MHILTLKASRTHVALTMFAASTALLLIRLMPLGFDTILNQTPLLVAAIFTGILALVEANHGRRRVEFDSAKREIRIEEVGILGGKSISKYEADDFGLVVSYLTRDRFVRNPVALITRAKPWRMVELASYAPASTAKGFLSMPQACESAAAASLRRQVTSHLGIQDGEFIAKEIRLPRMPPSLAHDARSESSTREIESPAPNNGQRHRAE